MAEGMIDRRSLLAGLITAPAIVRPGSIMRVRRVIVPVKTRWTIASQIVGRTVRILHPVFSDLSPQEYLVRVSPLHGELRVGDSVWIDQNTGEVV